MRAALIQTRHEARVVPALLTSLAALGPISTDLYLPSLPGLAQDFGVSQGDAQLTLSSFILGMAMAQLIYGPLADRFGRRFVLLAGLGLYVLASMASLFAPQIEVLILARFIQGAGGCAAPVLARAIVRDRWGLDSAARIMSYMSSAAAIAPAVGPILGGVLELYFGWRGGFVAMLAYGTFGWIGILLLLPETLRTPDLEALRPGRMLRNYAVMLSYRSYIGCILANGLAYGAIFSYISGSSFLLIEFMGLQPHEFGFCFSAAVIGYIAGAVASARIGHRQGLSRTMRLGAWVGAGAGILLLITGYWLAEWGLYRLHGTIGAMAIVGPIVVLFAGLGLVLPNAQAMAIGPFPQQAGAASGLLGFMVLATASLIGGAVGQFHDGTQIPMLVGMAGCSVLLPLAVRLASPGPRTASRTKH